jgi:integrase
MDSEREGRSGWHDLRRTYGSHLAMRGVPLEVIQELMGHDTMDTTMRYAHLSPGMHRETAGGARPAPCARVQCDTDGGGRQPSVIMA